MNRDTIVFNRTALYAAYVAEITAEKAVAALDSSMAAFSGLPVHRDEFRESACVEVYVPWWAWPLEMAHRAIFGRQTKSATCRKMMDGWNLDSNVKEKPTP